MLIQAAMNPKLRGFDVVHPGSLSEAVRLHGNASTAEYLGGGSALLSTRYARKLEPELLVNLKRIPVLRGIVSTGEGVALGALLTCNELARDPRVRAQAGVLAMAAAAVGSHQVRNLATIGGNACNASYAADLAAPLLALDASFVFSIGLDEQRVPATAMWRGTGETSTPRVAILCRVEIPPQTGRAGVYLKFGLRRALELGVANVAVVLEREVDGTVRDARIALSGIDAIPFRVPEAEDVLRGATDLNRAARVAGEAAGSVPAVATEAEDWRAAAARSDRQVVMPEWLDDFRATYKFRRRIVPVLVRRAIAQAAAASTRGDLT